MHPCQTDGQNGCIGIRVFVPCHLEHMYSTFTVFECMSGLHCSPSNYFVENQSLPLRYLYADGKDCRYAGKDFILHFKVYDSSPPSQKITIITLCIIGLRSSISRER